MPLGKNGTVESGLPLIFEVDGEKARAQDAISYISPGIGFCFMTQFSRLVPMLTFALPDRQIVQNTHFSLGDASGGAGSKAGAADAAGTHVYPSTQESGEVAQETPSPGGQTCFPHDENPFGQKIHWNDHDLLLTSEAVQHAPAHEYVGLPHAA